MDKVITKPILELLSVPRNIISYIVAADILPISISELLSLKTSFCSGDKLDTLEYDSAKGRFTVEGNPARYNRSKLSNLLVKDFNDFNTSITRVPNAWMRIVHNGNIDYSVNYLRDGAYLQSRTIAGPETDYHLNGQPAKEFIDDESFGTILVTYTDGYPTHIVTSSHSFGEITETFHPNSGNFCITRSHPLSKETWTFDEQGYPLECKGNTRNVQPIVFKIFCNEYDSRGRLRKVVCMKDIGNLSGYGVIDFTELYAQRDAESDTV